ncbi:isocitrate lyase/phosphoenolpyruvate mutase family protein [Aquamicrobium sp. LC103]|uniref:isocitrate lyase/PEP mutase family protein n=1 Tax=Aquamicrobium sp. LC103 TaxID=1120658 RepID=UPI00063E8275|nr:isocitrate lyase/phosphoenolpyruvate mutase family protein [Aquamicrobium sp. LC103]TKT74874.1 isocitrate lyase/phosphoenolpyruvate mutase family protein [Aquamicrobium sp. LC103]
MDRNADKGATFRKLHEKTFVIPNPWDVGTAKFLASLGFEALATTSAGYAFSRGLPDGGVSFDEMISHCRELVTSVDLPVSADLEHGRGDSPEDAAATIVAAEAAGLAGCSIEDSTGDPADPIYDFGLAVERVAAAVEAARGLKRDFVFTARAENFLWGRTDLDDTIRRLQAFEKAGADVLYAPALGDVETVRTVCAAVNRPVNVLAASGMSVAELAEAGAKRISVGSKLTTAAFGAVEAAAREMLDQGTFEYARKGASFAALQKLYGEAR